eukprot:m.1593301 g.1593301  ORF g.1593301 m.1593301 type:complete len:189 (+) comp25338_c0_seq42:5233-5799(+)
MRASWLAFIGNTTFAALELFESSTYAHACQSEVQLQAQGTESSCDYPLGQTREPWLTFVLTIERIWSTEEIVQALPKHGLLTKATLCAFTLCHSSEESAAPGKIQKFRFRKEAQSVASVGPRIPCYSGILACFRTLLHMVTHGFGRLLLDVVVGKKHLLHCLADWYMERCQWCWKWKPDNIQSIVKST